VILHHEIDRSMALLSGLADGRIYRFPAGTYQLQATKKRMEMQAGEKKRCK